jgi:hypothetical protein
MAVVEDELDEAFLYELARLEMLMLYQQISKIQHSGIADQCPCRLHA